MCVALVNTDALTSNACTHAPRKQIEAIARISSLQASKDFVLSQGGMLASTRAVVGDSRLDTIGTLCRAWELAQTPGVNALDAQPAPVSGLLSAASSRLVIQFSGQGIGYLEELRQVCTRAAALPCTRVSVWCEWVVGSGRRSLRHRPRAGQYAVLRMP